MSSIQFIPTTTPKQGCAICLEETPNIEEGPYVYHPLEIESGGHYFHRECLKTWITHLAQKAIHSDDAFEPTCSLCRREISLVNASNFLEDPTLTHELQLVDKLPEVRTNQQNRPTVTLRHIILILSILSILPRLITRLNAPRAYGANEDLMMDQPIFQVIENYVRINFAEMFVGFFILFLTLL